MSRSYLNVSHVSPPHPSYFAHRVAESCYPDIAKCRSCLGDEAGFADWMERVRDEWQAKLEGLDGQDEEMRPLPEGIPEPDDSCVPLNELQRSKVCPLLGQWHAAGKKRCTVSL